MDSVEMKSMEGSFWRTVYVKTVDFLYEYVYNEANCEKIREKRGRKSGKKNYSGRRQGACKAADPA